MDEAQCSSLAAAARAGDRESFRLLVEGLSRSLLALAYRYVRDWDAAADLTQETWVRVHGHLDRYDASRPFVAWVGAILRHRCLDHLRRLARRPEDAVGPEALDRLAPAAAAPDPDAGIEAERLDRRLRLALPALTPRQRLVFALVDLEGRERDEVARRLGISPATVRTTLHFARRRLAGLLRRQEVEP